MLRRGAADDQGPAKARGDIALRGQRQSGECVHGGCIESGSIFLK